MTNETPTMRSRALCGECGEPMVKGDPYAVCPNGHAMMWQDVMLDVGDSMVFDADGAAWVETREDEEDKDPHGTCSCGAALPSSGQCVNGCQS